MLDILAIAAHPDDAELGCGATLAFYSRHGRRAGIVDLTRGELASRGTPEIRAGEAAAAGRLLGLAVRENLALPDGGIDPRAADQRSALIDALRRLRPRLLLLPWHDVRHPDHGHACRLGEEAVFRAGLHRIETAEKPFRPESVFYYMERHPFEPTFVVDISADHATRMRAVRAYASQFVATETDADPATFLTRPGFLESLDARARHYGELAGVHLGEPFRARNPLAIQHPDQLAWQGER